MPRVVDMDRRESSVRVLSDVGGYRWFVDSLAKARGVPTNELQGSQRVAKAGG